ncbi:MAG: APC family permease [Bryobacteraceae bacterium]|nr:APC family permease [Bryobacteraceae bacterium]
MSLPRTLGLRDVTLFGLSSIVGTRWLATAAHAGPGSVTLFLLAGLFFVVPMAQCIGLLAARRPHAGGQYVWAREDFGEWHGFLAFWLYWAGIACWFPNAALAYMSIGAYAIDPSLVEHRTLIVSAAVASIAVGVGVNLLGARLGRWNQNAGGVATWLMVTLLIVTGVAVYLRQGSATPLHFAPPLAWETLSFWSQIAFALTGLELLGMMSGEIRDPARTIARAGGLAALLAVLCYSGATLAMVVLQKADTISELYGFMQVAAAGPAWLPAVFAALSMLTVLGQFGGIGSGTARLSYAAARDGLLPPIFARVHPRWQTPHMSMLTLAGVSIALLLLMQLGDTLRAAYQELVSLMVLSSFVPFLYIFLCSWKAGLRLAPVCGIAVTLLALLFAAIPTSDIKNVWLYEAKIFGGLLLLLGAGRWIYAKRVPR